MGTQITGPEVTAQFMAALSAAEHLTATTPVLPATISVAPHSEWGYLPGTFVWRLGVHLMFASKDGVRQFAAARGLTMSERPHFDDHSVLVRADGLLNEVPFRAWVLVDAEQPAVTA